MAYLLKKIFFSNRGMDKRTDGRTDGRSDYIMPQILFGGVKTNHLRYYLNVQRLDAVDIDQTESRTDIHFCLQLV